MSTAAETVKRFYEAFSQRDGDAMARCYSDDVRFSDPVFPALVGNEAGKMWRMLCARGKDLKIEYRITGVEGERVRVQWDAYYTFSKTKRPVHNKIEADLRVQNGKICVHNDRFNFWRWSSQALGPVGLLLGWTPIIQRKVRAEAQKSLQQYK